MLLQSGYCRGEDWGNFKKYKNRKRGLGSEKIFDKSLKRYRKWRKNS